MSDDTMVSLPKKARMEEGGDSAETSQKSISQSLRFSGFKVGEVLSDRPREKVIVVSGQFSESNDQAVVVLEKTPFTKETVQNILNDQTDTHAILSNDIYSSHHCFPLPKTNAIKASLIYPASEKHIEKHTSQEISLITETPELYKEVTLPFLEENQFSVQWVYNILEKKKEADRIVFEDEDPENGFILVPDMKWDGTQVEDLYLVAIVHRRGLRSIRDLNASHLPLLCNIRDKGIAAIESKYGVGAGKLRVYFHYQPSYYHLHVHFTHVRFDAPGSTVGRAVALQDVVNNLQIDTDYYSKATMCFTLGEKSALYKKYRELEKV